MLESAVRVGGRATCISAGQSLGIWTLRSPILHVRVPETGSRLRSRDDMRRRLAQDDRVRVHWRSGGAGTRHRVDADAALVDMIGCQSVEQVVAAADSAIRLGLMSRAGWRRLIRSYPARLRRLLADADGVPESFIESIVGFRLRRLGYAPRRQVEIPGVGRVDLMIGKALVIEVDGWEFHQSRDAFETDRTRDAELIRRDFRVIRLTYRRIRTEWQRVVATIRDIQ